ncbi:protein of unknown function [Bradyrhizobium vignae]|uniref:Uncharacterized protein n=1 Tax=Bradyrhizobium vignae TaxID=1549949 RepID=A0A2U3PRC0_9BRAD|nr:protein of unknown function [Bradyrhizobium vignae]
MTFGKKGLFTPCLLVWASPRGRATHQIRLMNEGGNPDGTNYRPAKLLLGAVRRASNAAQRADRCRRHKS